MWKHLEEIRKEAQRDATRMIASALGVGEQEVVDLCGAGSEALGFITLEELLTSYGDAGLFAALEVLTPDPVFAQ